ncbi:acyl-coenzyme A thioesterase 13 isoform X2 [Halyomorpha halys]|uniref:acyl-coenzyme A thioesterase 13 isoform X2 n=1 Tax=Halyomorpha halys TaxID=286706 RepID=UPI0006D4E8CF|nr:acyl-coenzyme A thioesterase 13-like isoform X3 [Halyomorpha halys]
MAVSNIVKQAWNRLMERKVGFEQVLKKVTLTHAADGVCLAEMTVDQEHTNSIGTLHGGLTSTLVDTISGMALATKTKDGSVGVSIDLHVTDGLLFNGIQNLKSRRFEDFMSIRSSKILERGSTWRTDCY